jgi:hypothetical protein
LKDVLARALNLAARLRQLQAPSLHFEKRRAEALGKPLHLEGYGRLREAHLLGGAGDAPEPRDGLERGDLCQRAASIQPAKPGVPQASLPFRKRVNEHAAFTTSGKGRARLRCARPMP